MIAGAGPAGLSLALQFSRAGVATTLVEASRSFERRFRGEALMPSGLEAMEAMGLTPLLGPIPKKSLRQWQVVVNGRELFSVPEPPPGSDGPGCTLLNQPALLQALLSACLQQPSFRWIQGQGVVDLLRTADRVSGLRLANGENLPAELVVACDGRRSRLRSRAGITLEEQPQPLDLLWMQLPGETPPPLAGAFLSVLGDQGLFSAFENVSGALQIGWVIEPGAPLPALTATAWSDRLAQQSPPQLAGWLRRWGDRLEEPIRLAVRSGLAQRWWQPGLLLLGDAAHPMSPVRAQGINMALRDAWLAAERLTPLLQAGAATAQLDAALPALTAQRQAEVAALQQLQRQETQRGTLLRRSPWLRGLVASAAPLLGAAIGHHWQLQQRPLRLGLPAGAAMMGP